METEELTVGYYDSCVARSFLKRGRIFFLVQLTIKAYNNQFTFKMISYKMLQISYKTYFVNSIVYEPNCPNPMTIRR